MTVGGKGFASRSWVETALERLLTMRGRGKGLLNQTGKKLNQRIKHLTQPLNPATHSLNINP